MVLVNELVEKLNLLLDNLETHLWILSKVDTYEFANRTHADFLGVDKDKLKGKKLLELLDNKVALHCYNSNLKVIEEKRAITTKEWAIDSKGNKVLLKIDRAPILDENGEVKFIVCKALDITEEYQKNKRIRINEEQYKAIVENQTNLICRFLPDYTLTYVNKAYCNYFNKSFDELVGTSFLALIPKKDHEKIKKHLNSLNVNNSTITYEHQVINSKGEICWQRWTDQAFFDNEGNIVEYQSVGIDITELKNKEKYLEETCSKIKIQVEEKTKLLERTKEDLIKEITERKAIQEKLRESIIQLRNSLNSSIDVILKIIEMKDPYTLNHQIRVAYLAYHIAKEMRLSPSQLSCIYIASLLHDVGKIYIPTEILCKPGKLTEVEFNFVKMHCDTGYEILSKIEFPWAIADIIYQHHERINGSGYPRGLTNEEIMLESKIIAVADVVEAMSSHRPYRASLGINAALKEIEAYKGIKYDDKVVNICVSLFKEKNFQLKDIKFDIASLVDL